MSKSSYFPRFFAKRSIPGSSVDTIRSLVRNNAVTGLHIIDDGSPFFCESCEYAKATRKTIRKERTAPLASAFGEEIHTDLWGPSPLLSLGSHKYYVTFTNDHTRYTQLKLLRSKDETLEAYKTFAAWAQTQHGCNATAGVIVRRALRSFRREVVSGLQYGDE